MTLQTVKWSKKNYEMTKMFGIYNSEMVDDMDSAGTTNGNEEDEEGLYSPEDDD